MAAPQQAVANTLKLARDSVQKYLRFAYARQLPNGFADYSNLVTPDVMMVRPSGKPFPMPSVFSRLREAEADIGKMQAHNLLHIDSIEFVDTFERNVAVATFYLQQDFHYKEQFVSDVALHTAVLERAGSIGIAGPSAGGTNGGAKDPLGMEWKMVFFQRCGGTEDSARRFLGSDRTEHGLPFASEGFPNKVVFTNEESYTFGTSLSWKTVLSQEEKTAVEGFVGRMMTIGSGVDIADKFRFVLPSGKTEHVFKPLSKPQQKTPSVCWLRALGNNTKNILVVFQNGDETTANTVSAVVEKRGDDFTLHHVHMSPEYSQEATGTAAVLEAWKDL